MSSLQNAGVVKKRKRTIKACEFCRKRKIKCDRNVPCLGCSKYGRVCKYVEKDPYAAKSDSNVYDELKVLRQKLLSLERSVNAGGSEGNSDPSTSDEEYDDNDDDDDDGDIILLLGTNKYASSKDSINFFKGYTSVRVREPIRRRNFGPFLWLLVLRRDYILHALWWYIDTRFREHKMQLKFLKTNADSPQIERDFVAKVSNDEGMNDITLYKKSPGEAGAQTSKEIEKDIQTDCTGGAENGSYVRSQRPMLRDTPASAGSIFYNKRYDEEVLLIENIRKVLPPKKVIWLMARRYFTHLYPFMPIIDQIDLEEDLDRIMGFSTFEHADETGLVDKIKVERRLDFANLGILLLMIRFGYLTISPNLSFMNQHMSLHYAYKDYVNKHPISLHVVEVAQMCLNQFNLMRSGNIMIMQLALLTRYYNLYAPEDGEGADGGDAQVFNAMLVQMAFMLGLNRDPENFPHELPNKRVNNLTRKIWFCLMIIDINYSMANGTPPNINNNDYDTKPPYQEKGSANVRDMQMEILSCNSLLSFQLTLRNTREMLGYILNVNDEVQVCRLVEKLDHFEVEYLREFKNLKSELIRKSGDYSAASIFPKIIRLKSCFVLLCFLMGIYFFLFTYYENKKNFKLASYYAKKICLITVEELMPFYFELHSNNEMLFQNASDLILIPEFQSTCHKSIIFLSAFYIRAKFRLTNLEADENHLTRLQSDGEYKANLHEIAQHLSLIRQCTSILRIFVTRLSHKYYYAWRVSKAQRFISKVVFLQGFYYVKRKECFREEFPFNTERLRKLNNIFKRTLQRVDHESVIKGEDSGWGWTRNDVKDEIDQIVRDDEEPPREATPAQDTANGKQYFTNDQVDMLWMQMMSMKKENMADSGRFPDGYNQGFNGVNANINDVDAQMDSRTATGTSAGSSLWTGMSPAYIQGMTPFTGMTPFNGNTYEIDPNASSMSDSNYIGLGNGYETNDSNGTGFTNDWVDNRDALGYESLIMSSFGMGPEDIFRDFT